MWLLRPSLSISSCVSVCDRRRWTAPCGCCGRLCLLAAVCLCVTGAAGQLRVAAAPSLSISSCVSMCDRRCWTAPYGSVWLLRPSLSISSCVSMCDRRCWTAQCDCCGRLWLSAAVCLCVTGAAGQLSVTAAAVSGYQQLCVYV